MTTGGGSGQRDMERLGGLLLHGNTGYRDDEDMGTSRWGHGEGHMRMTATGG